MTAEYLGKELCKLISTKRERDILDEFVDVEENEERFPEEYASCTNKLITLRFKISEIRKHIYNISPDHRNQCFGDDYEIDSVISIL